MWKTPICDMIGVKYPIIQAGMGPADTTQIAANTSKVGALGVVSAGMHEASVKAQADKRVAFELIMERINRVREATTNSFGFNVPINMPYTEYIIEALLDARKNDPGLAKQMTTVIMSAGDSKPYISRLKDSGLFTIHVVPSSYHAKRMEKLGIDAVVASGYEAGGHLSPDPVMSLVVVPAVVEAVKIPVLAAGGFGDAKTLLAALAFGAQGIQSGTRFIATKEASGFHEDFKRFIVEQCDDRSTIVSRGDIAPSRHLKNEWVYKLIKMIEDKEPDEKIYEYKHLAQIQGMVEGDLVHGKLSGGQIVGRIHDLPTVRELVEDRLMQGSVEVLKQVAETMGYSLVKKTAKN